MGEAVDPERPIGPLHNFGLATAVAAALQRVRQRGADEAGRILQHVADRAPGHVRSIERKLNRRQQDATALAICPLLSDREADAGARRDPGTVLLHELLA